MIATITKTTPMAFSLSPDRLVRYSLIVLYAFEVMAGPIRYILGGSGLYALAYAPKVEVLALSIFLIFNRFPIPPQFLGLLAIFVIFFFVGLLQLPDPRQPLYELWETAPLTFATLVSPTVFRDLEKYRFAFFTLFIIVVGGIFYNYFFDFPWSGQIFQISGQEIVSARKWQSGGFSRISGFSRASYDAAAQALLLGIFLISTLKSKFLSFLVWASAGLAIVITTTKGVTLSYSVISILVIPRVTGALSISFLRRGIFLIFSVLATFFLLAMISAPLLSLSYHFTLQASSWIQELLFLSFEDRLANTWPNAFSLMHSDLAFLFGNGLGAIGEAQLFYDPANFNPADNLFIYNTVQVGLPLSIFLLFYLLLKFLMAVRQEGYSDQRFLFLTLAMAIIVYGCTTNEVEDAFLSTALGFCYGYKPNLFDSIPSRVYVSSITLAR